jgi:sugar/nucleoside kinase (ribokinase family)
MGGEYTRRAPLVVAVGSASRDVAAADPRGWRLGGGVVYGALALARLGLPVRAVIGVDGPAATAWELDALRDAGAEIRRVPLRHAPVFTNREDGDARRQLCHDPGEPFDATILPRTWRRAAGWLFAPVAGELADGWSGVPRPEALVALGWQGLLRRLAGGHAVRRRAAGPHPLLARADLVGVSRHDLAPSLTLGRLAGWIGRGRPGGAELVLTAGTRGGLALDLGASGVGRLRLVPAIRSKRAVDPTGAGDVFLATLLAVRLSMSGRAVRPDGGLAFAAAAASLAVEGVGVAGVSTLAQIAMRMGIMAGQARGAREGIART